MSNTQGFKLVLWEDTRVDGCQINHRCIWCYRCIKIIFSWLIFFGSQYVYLQFLCLTKIISEHSEIGDKCCGIKCNRLLWRYGDIFKFNTGKKIFPRLAVVFHMPQAIMIYSSCWSTSETWDAIVITTLGQA